MGKQPAGSEANYRPHQPDESLHESGPDTSIGLSILPWGEAITTPRPTFARNTADEPLRPPFNETGMFG